MGVLSSIRVLEIGGIGPIPFVGMMLSDMGAETIRVERVGAGTKKLPQSGILERNRKRIGVDLKSPLGVDLILRLVETADVLIEGFRPGVMERLGLGPDECRSRNPRLIYGRMTGWGQEGPMAALAGHDLNYISTVGVTNAIGSADRKPSPPLNLVGDYGGGAMLLTVGVCGALFERSRSGQGQVIDAAMVDGAALLMNTVYELEQRGQWAADQRESNLLDGGAHFYCVYETADGKYLSVGASEAHLYRNLLAELALGDDNELIERQWARSSWPAFRERFAAVFRTRSRDDWVRQFEGKDVCCTPVLNFSDATAYAQHEARKLFVRVGEFEQAAPAPRFSRTPSEVLAPSSQVGEFTDEILSLAGISGEEATALKNAAVVL